MKKTAMLVLAGKIALVQLGYRMSNQGKNDLCDTMPDGEECKEIASMIIKQGYKTPAEVREIVSNSTMRMIKP